MTKPWDNEPTFNTDKNATKWGNYRKGEFIDADITRDLERRLCYAERLLNDVLCTATIYYDEQVLNNITAYFDAVETKEYLL